MLFRSPPTSLSRSTIGELSLRFSQPVAKLITVCRDRVGSATLLGRGPIDLAALEPMEQSELSVSLTDVKTGKHHGTVRIKMVFKPQLCVLALLYSGRLISLTTTASASPNHVSRLPLWASQDAPQAESAEP